MVKIGIAATTQDVLVLMVFSLSWNAKGKNDRKFTAAMNDINDISNIGSTLLHISSFSF